MFVFSREICGRKAVFLVIRFTSTLAWRVKSMMSLTGQRARYIYTLSRNSQIYLHCTLGVRALFSSTVVSFGIGYRPAHLKPREKLAKSESVRDNSGYPGRTDFRYLHWSALKVPKGCFRVRGSKNVFILTIWWLQVIILGRTVFYRCLPQGNSGLRSLLFQRGIIFVVLLNGVQSKITVVQYSWVRHPRSRVSLRLLLCTGQSQQRQRIRWTNQNLKHLAREKTRSSNLRLVGFLLVKSGGKSKQTWNFLLKHFWKKKCLRKDLLFAGSRQLSSGAQSSYGSPKTQDSTILSWRL